MKIVFLGATQFSREILLHVLENGFSVSELFTIPEEFSISYSSEKVKNYNFADLKSICDSRNISCHFIDSSEKGKKITEHYDMLSALQPDVILVIGWYYMVPKKIRDIAKYGAWGIHASMLPNYAGGAPLVWAMINGETETGVSLFKLDNNVDDGDIISQEKIRIEDTDSIKEVYEKVTSSSKKMLLHALQNISKIEFKPQDKSKIKVFPQRKPDDGEIDLSKPAKELYDFIRAQSSPYPGAFIKTADGKKLIIEKARIE
ncbi:methionyl-tRNA formyltransferase [soil metagenome]